MAKVRAERPKIQQQFADLKRGLSAVTDAEWESLPEVGNLTRKKRRREERTYVVPDSILVGDRGRTEIENSLDSRQQQVSLSKSNTFIAKSPSRLGDLIPHPIQKR
jgi:pre-mRNA-processing factor 6